MPEYQYANSSTDTQFYIMQFLKVILVNSGGGLCKGSPLPFSSDAPDTRTHKEEKEREKEKLFSLTLFFFVFFSNIEILVEIELGKLGGVVDQALEHVTARETRDPSHAYTTPDRICASLKVVATASLKVDVPLTTCILLSTLNWMRASPLPGDASFTPRHDTERRISMPTSLIYRLWISERIFQKFSRSNRKGADNMMPMELALKVASPHVSGATTRGKGIAQYIDSALPLCDQDRCSWPQQDYQRKARPLAVAEVLKGVQQPRTV
uniref:Uncharacterized protein n=1 Tax=Ananas comosus var. bracteatus TaxID=296719 RepID=A0A6V7PEX6_ANACO|nr:unnamed protein product [Ananas comosus var. bracteatus]